MLVHIILRNENCTSSQTRPAGGPDDITDEKNNDGAQAYNGPLAHEVWHAQARLSMSGGITRARQSNAMISAIRLIVDSPVPTQLNTSPI